MGRSIDPTLPSRDIFDSLDSLDQHSFAADGSSPPGRSIQVVLSQREILKLYSPEERELIQHRLYVLSGYSQYVGQDFKMTVELNQPGQGWHWDSRENVVRVDPEDLLTKPPDYLRGVFVHEGAHRRITDYSHVTSELLRYPSFKILLNAIEDARINNFAIDAYPTTQAQLEMLYKVTEEIKEQVEESAVENAGFKPKSIQASFELLRLWFEERSGRPLTVRSDLPADVQRFIADTLKSAQTVWWTYPSPAEFEKNPRFVQQYCRSTFETIVKEIWPKFRELVQDDLKHEEFLQMLGKFHSHGVEIPIKLASELSEEELSALFDALASCDGSSPGGAAGGMIVLDKIPNSLAEKLKELMDKLSESEKSELSDAASQALNDALSKAGEELESKESSPKDAASESDQSPKIPDPKKRSHKDESAPNSESAPNASFTPEPTQSDADAERERVRRALDPTTGKYESVRAEISPLINRLENELRAIFIERKRTKWLAGNKWGQKLNIPLRIKEIARGVSAADSRIFMRRLAPKKQDYAITLLVDLSGSMGGSKINETFKAAIMLAEVFSRLGIKFEILGFNSRLHEFKTFGEQLNKKVRDAMGSMPEETRTGRAGFNDDGWALEKASTRLLQARASERFLIVLSDGLPVPSHAHAGPEFELSHIIKKLMQSRKLKLVGLGIGRGTSHVSEYYPNSVSDVEASEFPRALSELLRTIITDGDKFS